MTGVTSLPFGIENAGAHGFRVSAAELEDVADLDGFADLERRAAVRAALALDGIADVGCDGGGEVAARRDVAEVVVELVGAGDHVGAAFEGLVEDDGDVFAERIFCCGEANRAQVPGGAIEPGLQLFGAHIAQLARAGDIEQLGFVDRMVATQEDGERLPFSILRESHVGQGLDVVLGQHLEESDDVRDGGLAGSVDALRLAIAGGARSSTGASFEVAFSRLAA